MYFVCAIPAFVIAFFVSFLHMMSRPQKPLGRHMGKAFLIATGSGALIYLATVPALALLSRFSETLFVSTVLLLLVGSVLLLMPGMVLILVVEVIRRMRGKSD